MENNIGVLHIEFFGLPGSGKSTISHELSICLREKGYKVEEPSYIIDNRSNKIVRYSKKIFYAVKLLIINHKQYFLLKKLLKKNGYVGLNNTKQLFNIAYKKYMYLHPKKHRIYVWDQGILQSSISLSTYSNVNVIDNCNSLTHDCNMESIYITTSKEEIYRRLESREKHGSSLEKTLGVEQEKLFKTIDSCCKRLKTKKTIMVENNNIDNSVKSIINKLNI